MAGGGCKARIPGSCSQTRHQTRRPGVHEKVRAQRGRQRWRWRPNGPPNRPSNRGWEAWNWQSGRAPPGPCRCMQPGTGRAGVGAYGKKRRFCVQRSRRLPRANYNPNSSRSRLVWARLTGTSVCFLSSMRSWYELLNQGTTSLIRLIFTR